MSLFCSSVGVIQIANKLTGNEVLPSRSSVEAYAISVATGGVVADPFASTTWANLPHCISAELTANTETANKIRTSDTAGARVAPSCASLTEYELSARNALDVDDWLWCYLLDTPTNPQTGRSCWIRIRPFGSAVATGQIYLRVKINPGGYGFDNDATEAQVTEWSAEVLDAPVYPGCGADKEIDNAT